MRSRVNENYFLQGKEIARSGAEAVPATALSVESGCAIQVRIPNIHPFFWTIKPDPYISNRDAEADRDPRWSV